MSWSRYSFEDIKSQEGWKPEGGALYALREDAGLHLTAVFRCKIEGSRQEQELGLPLKVETRVSNIPDFESKLLGELTAGLRLVPTQPRSRMRPRRDLADHQFRRRFQDFADAFGAE
ncbi:hypothetical protein [Streptomyces antibioticus]|uniref:hypothetical protein n=1 Tax=Streptomyces antibioticus TaxID=1890 RepID=UPI003F463AF6